MHKNTIIFFGTHEFAAHILQYIIERNALTLSAIVTQPDKPAGRTQTLEVPPIKKLHTTLGLNVPLLQPASLKNEETKKILTAYGADLFVVVEYGTLIPKEILAIPMRGVINVHPSLLPEYRGPSPIQQALIDGKKETGTTIMLLDEAVDHGPILAQEKCAIEKNDTFATLRETLARQSAALLLKTIPRYLNGAITPQPQDHGKATFTKLLTREDGRVDWHQSAEKIYNLWRGLHPWPGIFTFLNNSQFGNEGRRVKLIGVQPSARAAGNQRPGALVIEENKLYAATKDYLLEILKLQEEGKKPLAASEFMKGFRKKERMWQH